MKSEMSRREFIIASGLGAASLAIPGNYLQAIAESGLNKKTNFLFVLIDDMGWSDLGCYGNQFHETPNIDSLSKAGIRFTDAYAAGPVCSPTRASMLAGQYPARIGITDFIPGHQRPWAKLTVPQNRLAMPLETVTIAEVLKEYGYATGHIGKWHLGDKGYGPDSQGFDKVIEAVDNLNDKQVTGITCQAIKFIQENKDKPFFLYLAHHTVHIPLEAPQSAGRRTPGGASRLAPCQRRHVSAGPPAARANLDQVLSTGRLTADGKSILPLLTQPQRVGAGQKNRQISR